MTRLEIVTEIGKLEIENKTATPEQRKINDEKIYKLGRLLLKGNKKVTKKNKTKSKFGKWLQVAEDNGIKEVTFRQRVRRGMGVEKAATEPVMSAKEKGLIKRGGRTIPKDIILLAESNGINYQTLYYRIKAGMDYKKAATKPVRRKKR